MEFYKIANGLAQVKRNEITPLEHGVIVICTQEEAQNGALDLLTENIQILQYEYEGLCKIETAPNCMYGSFSVPEKAHEKNADLQHVNFAFCIQAQGILFLDGSGLVSATVQTLALTNPGRCASIGQFFSCFLESLISNDLYYLNDIQEHLAKLEDDILEEAAEDFNEQLMNLRKEILSLHRYYAQMMDVGEDLQENENGFFEDKSIALFRRFTDRIARLLKEAASLREYCMQVREAYASQIDLRQNSIMKVLTVVTTVFSPLTLLTGWYGMNFADMPELHWKYGYLCVFLVSLAISGICLLLFKHKKFL